MQKIKAKLGLERFGWREFFLLHLGVVIVAIGVAVFKYPNNFAMGGVSGLSVVLAALIPGLSPGAVAMITNALLILLALVILGKGLAFTTAYSSLLLSWLLILIERYYPLTRPLAVIPHLLIYLALGLILALPLKILAYLLCLMLVSQLLTLTFLLGIGAIFPVLNWDSEAALVRGGKNVFWVYLEMIIALALLAGPASLIFFNLRHAWIDFGLSYLLALGLLLLLFLISLVFCYGFAVGRLAKREG